MRKILVLYMPVLHAGYLRLFASLAGRIDALYILGLEFTQELSPFGKEIRAVEPDVMRKVIEALELFPVVRVLTPATLDEVKDAEILTADEEVSQAFAKKYLQGVPVAFEKIFLRWDATRVKANEKVAHARVSTDAFDREMTSRAAAEAEKSSDWWRHVGAVVVRDRKIISESHNQHVPSEHTPYAVGDPRDVIEPGTMNLVYSSIHAEQDIVARAARDGAVLAGTDIYMNYFPCPLCAKLIATAGVKRCFFKTGSTWLDAESVLKAAGVEIILVQ